MLEADKGTAKKPGPDPERWAKRIAKFAAASANKGYIDEDVAPGDGNQDAATPAAAAGATLAANAAGDGAEDQPRGFKGRSKRSFYGYDEDAAAKSSAAKGAGTKLDVTLKRPDVAASWGLGIGVSSHQHHVVTVVSEGVGFVDGKLLPGDIIFKLDGADASTIDHDDMMELLKSATEVTFGIRRPEGGLDADSDEEDEEGFGF